MIKTRNAVYISILRIPGFFDLCPCDAAGLSEAFQKLDTALQLIKAVYINVLP